MGKTEKVTYVGPLGDGVTVVVDGHEYEFPPGDPVEVPADVAHGRVAVIEQDAAGEDVIVEPARAGLLERHDFERVGTARKTGGLVSASGGQQVELAAGEEIRSPEGD